MPRPLRVPFRASRPLRLAAALALAPIAAPVVAPAPLAAQTRPAGGSGPAWSIPALPQATVVLARDGRTTIAELGREIRTSVAFRTLPRYLPAAFVAVEDKRFYQHNGVDVVGIAGALKDAVMGDARGASTITQQLVGNLHPDQIDRRDRSAERKIREQAAALEMERRYSKEQILEGYLNAIYFNHGRYGVDAAARYYFGKPAAEVTLAEAATLASMPKSPVLYDPSRHPERVRDRRNTVLDLMAEQGIVSRAQAAAAKAEPVRTVPDASGIAPWFVDVVRIQAERAGVKVREGGFRIVTTLDPALQRAAVAALAEQAAAIEGRKGWRRPTLAQAKRDSARSGRSTDYLQGVVVAVDPESGEVRALVGGRDYGDSPFNRAVDGKRQPGSSFKPFVYAAALAQGVPPNAAVGDTAIAVPLGDGRTYAPQNSDDDFLGIVPLREALARSRNPVAVQLWQQATPDSVIALARRAGLQAPIAPYPSSALGASVVQPLDFVTAYATFDNGGLAVAPRFVTRVDDRGGRTVWAPPRVAPTPALDPRVAFQVRDLLRDAVERGTATSVRRFVPARIPLAGKTGTTNDNADVWFVGMTPELVVGAWLGFDRPTTIAPGAVGGTLAAPVVGQTLATWYRGRGWQTAGEWTPPADLVPVVLDRQSGLPADSTTAPERRYTEWFLPGTEPGARPFEPITIFRNGAVGPR